MLRKLLVLAVFLCVGSYLHAGNASIGSVVAQGDLRIDGHSVQGTGTLFDGTTVETGSDAQSNADLRLANGVTITLHNNSSGTLYRDRFVLLRGEADISAPASFRAEANGLVVKGSEPRTSERIAIGPGGAVSVLAKTGQLQVVGDHGQILAQVHPQESLALARKGDGSWQIGNASSRNDDRKDDRDHDGGDDDHDRHHHHSH